MNGRNERCTSDGSLGDKTEKGVVFKYPPLIIMLLKVRPAHFRAAVQQESKVFAPQIVEHIMFRTSKTLIGGKEILIRRNCGVVVTKKNSRIMFILAKKSIIDSAASKNSALALMPTTWCLMRKRLAEYLGVLRFN